MQEADEVALASAWLPSAQRKLLASGVLATVIALSELYNGSVSKVLRYVKRSCAAAFAQWIEDQGGFPLFTIEGNEPEVTEATWKLPISISQQKGLDAQSSSVESAAAITSADEEVPGADGSSSSDLPNFFASTKFFACLDLLESQELFEATQMVKMQPKETLFLVGDDSQSGIFIVVEGRLGVYLEEHDSDSLTLTNTLITGESVGDLDVLDGARRSVTCIAMEEGATLVNVSRDLFMSFIAAKPRTLQIYLHKAMARLWRVAHFVLSDFLALSLDQMPAGKTAYPPGIPPTAPSASTANMELGRVGSHQPVEDKGATKPPLTVPAKTALAGSASGKLPKPQAAKERGGVKFAPQLEIVSEAPAHESAAALGQEMSLPRDGLKPAIRVRGAPEESSPSTSEVASPESFGVQMKTPFRDIQAEVDLDGALAQMGASFVDVQSPTQADEELYAAASHGRNHRQTSASGTESANQQQMSRSPSNTSIGQRRVAGHEKSDVLQQLRSTASRAGSQGLPSKAPSRRSLSLKRNLSQHLDQGTAAVPVSLRLPEAASVQSTQSIDDNSDTFSPIGVRDRGALLHDQDSMQESMNGSNPKLEAMDPGPLISDAEIASSIKNTMNMLKTMSLPLSLLKGAPSYDALADAVKQEDAIAFAFGRAASLRRPFNSGAQASLAAGWDVISPDEGSLTDALWDHLISHCAAGAPGLKSQASSVQSLGQSLLLRRGQLLHGADQPVRQFYILLEGNMLAERPAQGKGKKQESALVGPGSVLGAAAFLSSTRSRAAVRAAGTCRLAAFGPQELEALLEDDSDAFLELLLLSARALGPVIRRFISLGLNRVWLKAGDTAYRQGDAAESLYIIISGRLRLLREDPAARLPLTVEEEVGRGEAVGAVWALTGGYHDTTALCVRDSEFVRMSKGAFELLAQQNPRATSRMLEGMARRIAAASSARGRRSAFTASTRPTANTAAVAQASQANPGCEQSARRGEIVTIALVPAGSYASWVAGDNLAPATDGVAGAGADAARRASKLRKSVSGFAANGGAATLAVRKVAASLKNSLEELFGPTLHLNASTLEVSFPTAFQRLHISFYRSKLTSWMAAQEEDYRFILLEADAAVTPWSRICISHADCVLLVGAEEASPQVNLLEEQLVWAPMGPPSEAVIAASAPSTSQTSLLGPFDPTTSASWSNVEGTPQRGPQLTSKAANWAAQMRRVELVLLHRPGMEPTGTAAWISPRPLLARHHHVRLSNPKDMARVARWMAGKAVGLVLSGGGSRGLAHLGVLHALDDAGVPVDVIGGTSQGAFMAALYAQGLSWERMHQVVREYAGAMGSVRHLVSDLTLPLISVFSGAGFDRVVRESMAAGAQRIEDLWLNFFCMTTNLTRGEPSVHTEGLLWKLVRASMTIVGLVPPVTECGELLIDGGYLNNMPVDVMRGLGVDTVIVVDVEDRDDSVWHNLTPIDGGLSGWRLLWDRWCPIPALRYNIKMPRYNQIVNALTWMSHSQNLRRVAREHPIDLYLQPPVTRFRLLDYHLMDRIVRDSNRYAWAAISEWQCSQGVTQRGRLPAELMNAAKGSMRRARSVACMTQLQAKQQQEFHEEPDEPDRALAERDVVETAPEASAALPGLSQTSTALYNIPESLSSAASSSTEAALSDVSRDAGRLSFDSITSVPGTSRLVPPVAATSHADTSDTSETEPVTPGRNDVSEDIPNEASQSDMPLPFWESPTSFHLPPPCATTTAVAIVPPAAPLPIPMPTQLSHTASSSVANDVIASAAASVFPGGSPADNMREYPRSLPIVLSPFLSSDEEDNEGSEEAEAEGLINAAAARSGAREPRSVVDDEAKPNMSVGCNGGSPRRLASRNNFSRTRSNSFNSSPSIGGLAENMRTASTGLMDLPEAARPMGTAPVRIPVVPEVRRPSLPPGRGSLTGHFGSAGLHRQLSSHPSHAMPSDDMETPIAAYSSSYSSSFRLPEPNLDARRNSLADLSDIFDFPVVMPDALHGTAATQQNGSGSQPIRTSPGRQNSTRQAHAPASDNISSPAAE
ncbi:g3463 [Coccomyxa elongata]